MHFPLLSLTLFLVLGSAPLDNSAAHSISIHFLNWRIRSPLDILPKFIGFASAADPRLIPFHHRVNPIPAHSNRRSALSLPFLGSLRRDRMQDEDEDKLKQEQEQERKVLVQRDVVNATLDTLADLLGTPDVDSQSTPGNVKYVVAHHMVGNTYPYTIDDWKRDIQLASSHSIDGFVLNVGRDDWMAARVSDAYSAAQALNLPFKLLLSLDMTSLPCATQADMQSLVTWVNTYAQHPNQFTLNGKPLVSTFAGEGCSYGGGFNAAWTEFKSALSGNVHFVPSLFTDPTLLNTLGFLDGAFNWNGGWPTQLSITSTLDQIDQAAGALNTDLSFLDGLTGKTYIAPVSPWFFTHYGPDTWNKNWIYRADDWLFARRWEELISMRDRVDIVEIITWNDYGESHYIGPIEGAQPNSQAWVDGFDHQGWLTLSDYYIQAFKTGTYPTITQDSVFLWARPHPRDAVAPDHVPRPANAELTDDFFWAIVFAKEPATAVLYTPTPESDPNTQSTIDYAAATVVDIPAGINKLRYPLQGGRTMAIRLQRNGSTALDYRADGFVFNLTPSVYNFNAWVGTKTGA